ncbi:MAG: hypothetical protein RLZZ244_2613 [Verrucomicrobiota bacterium]|jgi:uncharacterized protein (UPF0261 family)
MATIAVLGTLDTKAAEHQFVADCIQQLGHQSLLIDVGTGAPPRLIPDLSRESVAELAGVPLPEAFPDRSSAVAAMLEIAPRALHELVATERIQGVISVGGECGTTIATAAMRALPLGFPKVMVSSLPNRDTSRFVGFKDIILFPSVADVCGLNRLLRPILTQAAGAICGIAEFAANMQLGEKPLVLASASPHCSLGQERAISIIEGAGYEVLRIPSNGAGGQSLESILESNLAAGVLDMSLQEWAEEVGGGTQSAGPRRLEAAAVYGVPAVIVPGCTDLLHPKDDPADTSKQRGRTFHKLSNKERVMRTSAAEAAIIGERIAEKINLSTGPVSVLIPTRGLSSLSSPGKPFHDPEADRALFKSLHDHLRKDISLRELKATINDTPFADACARALLGNIKAKQRDHENLKKVEFFEAEPESFLREIARMLDTQVFLPGDFIIRQDEVGDCMYFLASGTAEVLVNGQRVAKLGAGAPFGEMALVSGERRNASIRATEYCDVHRLGKEDFDLLRTKHPAFDAKVRTIVKQRIMSSLHT